MARHGFSSRLGKVRDRRGVFDAVAHQVRDKMVLYLEFGVYQGASMRYWSQALRHPEAKLHGFDSFEGLPESWGPYYETGHFDVGGKTPEIADPRVRFFKGWFDQVLPTYTVPAHEIMVINMDADLYTSTIYVLRQLREHIKPGTFIYFDEFNAAGLQELHAFDEFLKESRLRFEAVCHDEALLAACFQCTG